MKAYSIVSIILTCIFFIIVAAVSEEDLEASAGWAFLTVLYSLIFSIIGIVWSTKKSPKNITVMVMSIIGLVVAVIALIVCLVAFSKSGGNKWDYAEWLEIASGWGIIVSIWLLPHSIVSLVQSIRVNGKNETNASSVNTISSELEKLDDLRRKGIISDDEFEEKKRQIL